MTPFLEQLAAGLGLVLGLASASALIWGAARRQRGREAVDEQTSTKLATVKTTAEAHASKCDEDHRAHRDARGKLEVRVVKLETKLEALE
jgi:hypothetical protein